MTLISNFVQFCPLQRAMLNLTKEMQICHSNSRNTVIISLCCLFITKSSNRDFRGFGNKNKLNGVTLISSLTWEYPYLVPNYSASGFDNLFILYGRRKQNFHGKYPCPVCRIWPVQKIFFAVKRGVITLAPYPSCYLEWKKINAL